MHEWTGPAIFGCSKVLLSIVATSGSCESASITCWHCSSTALCIRHCTRLISASPPSTPARHNELASAVEPQVLLWVLVLTGYLHTQSACRDVRARISGYGALAVLFSFLSESMPIFSAMSLQNHGLAYSSTDFAIPAGAGGVWLMISATCIYPRVCKALGNKRYAPHLTQTLL